MSEVDRNGDVSGLHSWIYYHYVEHNKATKADFEYAAFKGFIELQNVRTHSYFIRIFLRDLNSKIF